MLIIITKTTTKLKKHSQAWHTQKQKHKTRNHNIQAPVRFSLNVQRKQYVAKKKTSIESLVSVLCIGCLLPGMRHTLKCGLYIEWDIMGENWIFLCCQLEIASGLGVGARVLSCLSSGTPSGREMCKLSESLWAHLDVCPRVLHLEDTISLISSLPPVLPIFSPPLLHSPLSPEGKGLMKTVCLG